MTDLAYRRVAMGREPVRDVLRWQEGGAAVVWRSRGAAVGRFGAGDAEAARVQAAVRAAAGFAPAETPSTLPAHQLAEYLELAGASLAVPAGTEVDGPWGELLEACRAAVDAPGAPVAVVTLVPEPPARLRIEHRGPETLELGFGALNAGIAWMEDGVETAYAGTTMRSAATLVAGPGWSTVLELDPPADASPAGEALATARFSILDEGVWIPVTLQV